MKHELMKLPYEYDSLKPYMDELTVKIHHDKHHQTYVDKLNTALEAYPQLQHLDVSGLLKDLSKIPDNARNAIKNNGGGVLNHNMFWKIMKKDVSMSDSMNSILIETFGTIENFKKQFTDAAMNRFGSGWAWLVINNGNLEIVSTPNQDTPLSEGKIPILLIDVWEHSYYILYQWQRAKYVEAFFNLINWDVVEENYNEAMKNDG